MGKPHQRTDAFFVIGYRIESQAQPLDERFEGGKDLIMKILFAPFLVIRH